MKDFSIKQNTIDKYKIHFYFILLLGYSTFNKGFAYLGISPLFIGEFGLFFGIFQILRSCNLNKSFSKLHLILTFFLVGFINAVDNIQIYGIQTLRDFAMIYYSIYLLIGYIYLNNESEFEYFISLLKKFIIIFLIYNILIILMASIFPNILELVKIPGTKVSLFYTKNGDIGVWLTFILYFSVFFKEYFTKKELGFVLFFGIILLLKVLSINRGGFVSFILPFGLYSLRSFKLKIIFYAFFALSITVLVVFSVDIEIIKAKDIYQRGVSTMQIRENLLNLVGFNNNNEQLNGTKSWRTKFWREIINDTVNNENYFWYGQGLGPSLLKKYPNFELGAEETAKHPHNYTINIFSRLGILGLLSWLFVVGTIIVTYFEVLNTFLKKNNRKIKFLFVAISFVLSSLINSNFDVFLEGPMGAIPFWFFFGLTLRLKKVA